MHGEILDLVNEDSLADEIEQVDTFKEGIYGTIVDIERHCMAPPAVVRTYARSCWGYC